LPLGCLKRASGPYCIQVVAESGPVGPDAWYSQPGVSRSFRTPSEDPGPVIWPRLAEPTTETTLRVEWDAPDDNGGSAIKEYKLALCRELEDLLAETPDSPMKSGTWSPTVTSKINTWATKETEHVIDGLCPGTSYRVEVRACSEENLVGPAAWVTARCAVNPPGPPTVARAQLLPGLLSNGGSDTIRIEFCAPIYDGGQQLEYFQISALEDQDPAVASKSPRPQALCEVAFADAAAMLGNFPPALGCRCACDVEVLPNQTHVFVVQASNGDRMSSASEATSVVFVPARVPSPPTKPAKVYTEQGGVAELQWESPEAGGGLPVTLFKIGIMQCLGTGQIEASEVIREVTIVRDAARHDRCAEATRIDVDEAGPLLEATETQLTWVTRIDGLDADTRYRFVIAVSNSLGTGRWSASSALVSTPVAAPAAPANPVATVALDSQRLTAVTVVWESGPMRSGSGNIVAFHLALTLEQVHDGGRKVLRRGRTDEWQCGKVLYDRLPVQHTSNSQRMTWSKPLWAAGRYRLALTSENTMGQRSAPAVLALNVSPEAFAPSIEPAPVPCWADEPLLLRGSVETKLGAAELSEQRFIQNVDGEARAWLQGLLLWTEDSGAASANSKKLARAASDPWSSSARAASIDVICFYRSPGMTSTDAQVAILGNSVTASRLDVSLPANVPMSLRLAARADVSSLGACPSPKTYVDMPQSEPLILLLSEEGHQLSAHWEVWSRRSLSGTPPRWAPLPSTLHALVEAAWLEGKPNVAFALPTQKDKGAASSEDSDLGPGKYQINFGDDRRIQHTVKFLGPGGWQAKARRSVFTVEGEDVQNTDVKAEDQCVICMERRRTHAFMHADTGDGHLAVCSECAATYRAQLAAGSTSQAFGSCPMCRRPFSAVQRIFQ